MWSGEILGMMPFGALLTGGEVKGSFQHFTAHQSTIHQSTNRDTANFGIKNDKSADTVLTVLFAFLVVVFG